jgi:hypothetical protein
MRSQALARSVRHRSCRPHSDTAALRFARVQTLRPSQTISEIRQHRSHARPGVRQAIGKVKARNGIDLVAPLRVLRAKIRPISTRLQTPGAGIGSRVERQRCQDAPARVIHAFARSGCAKTAGRAQTHQWTRQRVCRPGSNATATMASADTVQTRHDVMRCNALICCISVDRPHDGKSRERVFHARVVASSLGKEERKARAWNTARERARDQAQAKPGSCDVHIGFDPIEPGVGCRVGGAGSPSVIFDLNRQHSAASFQIGAAFFPKISSRQKSAAAGSENPSGGHD